MMVSLDSNNRETSSGILYYLTDIYPKMPRALIAQSVEPLPRIGIVGSIVGSNPTRTHFFGGKKDNW